MSTSLHGGDSPSGTRLEPLKGFRALLPAEDAVLVGRSAVWSLCQTDFRAWPTPFLSEANPLGTNLVDTRGDVSSISQGEEGNLPQRTERHTYPCG